MFIPTLSLKIITHYNSRLLDRLLLLQRLGANILVVIVIYIVCSMYFIFFLRIYLTEYTLIHYLY